VVFLSGGKEKSLVGNHFQEYLLKLTVIIALHELNVKLLLLLLLFDDDVKSRLEAYGAVQIELMVTSQYFANVTVNPLLS